VRSEPNSSPTARAATTIAGSYDASTPVTPIS
jgi:hypothetical protein